nr:hypothetical protein CFP56_79300 [Quercus suber]
MQVLEAYDCKGEQCELRKYFDIEAGLAELELIVNLKTREFFVSNFRRGGEKKAARAADWYEEAVRALTVEVPAYEEEKAAFNRASKNLHGLHKSILRILASALTNISPINIVRKEADSEVAEPEAVVEEEVEPEVVTEEVESSNEVVAASALLLLPAPAACHGLQV